MTWRFEVAVSPHDDVKEGILERTRTQVRISSVEYPSYAKARDVACCMAAVINGGMPTEVKDA